MILILVVILLITIFYWKCIKPMYYWKNQGVQQGNTVWFFGNNWGIVTRKYAYHDFLIHLYNLFPKQRYYGIYQFNIPTLLIRDPETIRQITVKNFDHFVDHFAVLPEDVDPLWAKNLFALTGDKWRYMRATLSPAFTSSKMRSMFVLIQECGDRFVNYFIEKTDNNGKEMIVEMKDAFTRFTNDVIASTAFGITCDSLKEQNNDFYLKGKCAINFISFWKLIKAMLYLLIPSIGKLIGLRMFSKEAHHFFTRIIKESIEARDKHGIVRPDMIHLLMEARKGRLEHEDTNQNKSDAQFAVVQESDIGKVKVNHKKEITDLDITAQALIFFFAGFETVSTLMCFLTYELAINPDIQEKLYQEIKRIEGKLTYEVLMKMKYLDKVVSETLRKWPPAASIDRTCVKPYTIQPKNPQENPVHLKVNDFILIPTYAIHHDEMYYPNPEKFDPERFNDENKQNIVPYTYLPFGSGPRNCIGSRFALLETKAVICSLLSKFEITVVDKTPIPIRLIKMQQILGSEDGFWVGLRPRK